jgi:hypothetical protein
MGKEKNTLSEMQKMMSAQQGVRGSMLRAGLMGKSRIKAGVREAWEQKKTGMFGDEATALSGLMRATGMGKAAEWYERFFMSEKDMIKIARKRNAKEKEAKEAEKAFREKLKKKYPDEFKDDDEKKKGISSRKAVALAASTKGELRGINRKLDFIFQITSQTQSDVSDIKSLIMPKLVRIKGTSGKNRDVQYNPLSPEGHQYQDVFKDSRGGTGLTYKKLSAKDKENAGRRVALETAKLVMKMQEEEKKKVELKSKFSYKDQSEEYERLDPVAALKKHIDKRFDKLEANMKKEDDKGIFGWISGLFGGLWDKIMGFFKNPLAILGGLAALMPFASLIGKAGLVGMAGYLGYELGTWLNDKFKLDQKINDAIQTAMGWFGKGNEAKIRASDEAAVAKKNKSYTEINRQLEGTGYKKQEMKLNEDGSYSGGGYVDAQGKKVLEQDLPPNVRRKLGLETEAAVDTGTTSGPTSRGRRSAAVSTESTTAPVAPSPPSTPSVPATGGTGTLSTKPSGNLPMPGDSVKEYILAASKKVGVEPGIMMAVAKQESSFNPNAIPIDKKTGRKLSSAKGLYQFIDSTWSDMVRKYGSKYPELHKGPLDPLASAIAGALFIKENSDFLRKKGLPINGTSIYAAHFLGAGGAAKLFGSDPNAVAANVMPAAAKSNPHIFYKNGQPKTISEVQDTLFNKVGKYADQYTAALGGTPTQSAPMMASATPAPSGGGGSVTPASSSSATAIDKGNRELTAANAPSGGGSGLVVGPTINNTTNNTVGKRPAAKADVVSRDDALVRSANRDAVHPVYA